jgi:hypothetical protein
MREEEPVRVFAHGRGGRQEGDSASLEVGQKRSRGSRLESELEGLAALGPPRPDGVVIEPSRASSGDGRAWRTSVLTVHGSPVRIAGPSGPQIRRLVAGHSQVDRQAAPRDVHSCWPGQLQTY